MVSIRIFDSGQHGYIDITTYQFHAANIEIMQFQMYSFEDLDWEPSEVHR